MSICLTFWGWVMTAYQLSLWGWWGSALSLLYLSWAGLAAIPLALAWIVGLFWIAAQVYAEPQLFYWVRGSIWACSLIVLWGMGIMTLVAIAQGPSLFQQMPKIRRFFWLSSLQMTSLLMGHQLYQLFISP